MNQIGGSRTDTLVKLVLIFFISLFSFSVGTYVGKSVTEKQYQNTMYDPTGEEAVEQASRDEEGSKSEAVDDDALSLTDEFANLKKEGPAERKVASEEHKDATATPEHAEAHVAPTTATKTAPAHAEHKMMEPAQRVAVGKAPTEAHAAAPHKAETLPHEIASSTTGKWTLQIASYPKEDEAKKQAEDLKAKGFSAFYIPAQVKGQTWYRVSVGQFTSKNEASGYKDEFVKKSSISKVIVQKITQ